MATARATPTKIFYCYARKDSDLREELRAALSVLRNQALIEDWSDRDIAPGGLWDQEIVNQLRSADLVLLLVSFDFLASEYIVRRELEIAMARHQSGQAAVVPVILRPVHWKGLEISKLQALPANAKPIVEWEPRDAGWASVVKELDELIRGLASRLPRQRQTPHRGRWPRPLTPLVGRDQESGELRKALSGDDVLVTLFGPVGVGKSHMALDVGADPDVSGSFPDGIHRIDLSTVGDPALLAPTIARELGVEENGGSPLWREIADFIGDQRRLLLLDGFDRVLPARQEVADLLQATSALKLIVTSRSRLDIPGERVISVDPLQVPVLDPLERMDVLAQRPAVQLFVQRARSVQASFTLTQANTEVIAKLCVQVSGLPLAIQLLAGQIAVLSPAEILERLPVLVEPLTEVISASADLLDPLTAKLFADLGAFAGGFTLAAAEAVAHREDVFSGLRTLLDVSLVLVRTANERYRYFMLAPVNEQALRRLAASPEQKAVLDRHARYHRELMERAERQVEGAEQEAWLAALEPENANLRTVLERSLAGVVDVREGLRLAAAMGPLWYVRGQFGEGRLWLERLLAVGDTAPPPIRAKAVNFAGILTYHQNDYAEARRLLEQGLRLFDELPDDAATTDLLRELGFPAKDAGRAKSLNGLGFVAKEEGDVEASRGYYEESLELYRRLDDEWGIVWTATDLALVLLQCGDSARSVELLEESRNRQKDRLVRGRSGLALSTIHLAYARAAAGDPQRAAELADEALEASRSLGYKRGVILAAHFAGLLSLSAARPAEVEKLAEAEKLLRESLGLCREVGDKAGMAESLEALAAIAGQRGDLPVAARFRVAAEDLWQMIGRRGRRAEYDAVAAPRDLLSRSDAATRAERDRGRPGSLDRVVEEALGEGP